MKKHNRLISLLIVFIMTLSFVPPVQINASEEYPVFTDTSKMSDEEFFGVWNDAAQEWTTAGKLNYSEFPGLADTEKYVKLGSYDAAKEALYEYYKNREGYGMQKPYGSQGKRMVFLAMHQMYNFTEQYITSATIEGTEYKEYEVELKSIEDGQPQTAKGTFMLAASDKSADIVGISSKEGDESMRPVLRFYMKNGTIVDLPVLRDSYTRAYNDDVSYISHNYGREPELLISDDYYQKTDGSYSPVGANTRETYLQFDPAKIENNEDIYGASLIFYARILPEDGEEITESRKEIMVFNSYNKSWKEYEGDETTGPVLTWKNISHTHYSWNGLPGGFDWSVPADSHAQWKFYNMRFYQVSGMIEYYLETGDDKYIYAAIEMVLDFINDAGAGTPNNDIEPGNRSIVLPIAIPYFMESPYMNADALTAMMKYMWEEAEFLETGKFYQTDNNRGMWHTTGFHTIACYFPEYTDSKEWWEVITPRLDAITEILVQEDGCYAEATNSYPKSVADFMYTVYQNCVLTGREVPEYVSRLEPLSEYIMWVSYPNGVPPRWGEGGPPNMRSGLKTYAELLDNDALRYFCTNGAYGEAPSETSKLFPYLKVVSTKTDWTDQAYMLWMNAKNGSNHNHKDSLHLTLYAKDREVLTDTGMTSYDGAHPHFQWQRHTTRSHNTIEIDELPQRGSGTLSPEDNGESDIALYSNSVNDRIKAWTDASKGFRHYRDVSFLKDKKFVIVSDTVEPSDSYEHNYTQNWHSLPYSGAEIDGTTKTGRTNFESDSNIIIAQARPEELEATLEAGYDSAPADTKYFCYEINKAGNVAYDTVLFPVEEGNDVTLDVKNIETDTETYTASAMKIGIFKNNDPREDVIYYHSREDSANTHTFGEYTANAEVVIMNRNVDNELKSLNISGGYLLKENENIVFEAEENLENLSILYNNSSVDLYSSDDSAKSVPFRFSAPESVTDVTLNGSPTDFTYLNGSIYVNYDNMGDIVSDSGLTYSVTVEVDDDEHTVTLRIPENTKVVSGKLCLPEVSEDDGEIHIDFAEAAVLDRAAEIIVSDRSDADLYRNKRKISVTSTAVDRNDADSFDADTSIAVKGRRDITLWSKTLENTVVGAVKKSSSATTGGGGGGGSKPISANVGAASVIVPTVPSTAPEETTSGTETAAAFKDIAGHWAENDITELAQKGIVKGTDAAHFNPDANLTRAEFAALLVRAVGIEEAYANQFSDVSGSDWFAGVAGAASEAGIIKGSDGRFMPYNLISRQEMAAMMSRACAYAKVSADTDIAVSYSDKAECAQWAWDSVAHVTSLGLMQGVDSQHFAPLSEATRAQAAAIINRFIKLTGGLSDE